MVNPSISKKTESKNLSRPEIKQVLHLTLHPLVRKRNRDIGCFLSAAVPDARFDIER